MRTHLVLAGAFLLAVAAPAGAVQLKSSGTRHTTTLPTAAGGFTANSARPAVRPIFISPPAKTMPVWKAPGSFDARGGIRTMPSGQRIGIGTSIR